MKASIVDLRYKTKEVLKALERNEEVSILYRGKLRGRILPARSETAGRSIKDHPFFGSLCDGASVADVMQSLRGGRY